MSYSMKVTKSKTKATSRPEIPHLQTVIDLMRNPELVLVLKIGAGLWLFIGVCAVLGWVSMKPEARLLEVTKSAPAAQASLQLLGQKQQSRWRPGQHATGECGALQDSNMRRLGSSSTIQQFVDDAPPGYDTPYRVQQY